MRPSARTAGILVHPTSLPGGAGIGNIGDASRRWAGVLAEMGQQWWQMLPIGPTGYGDSPYQSPSTFAGNPLLIDLFDLCQDGLLTCSDLDDLPPGDAQSVDFGTVIPSVGRLLRLAAERLDPYDPDFEMFRRHHGPTWLDDYALFSALKRGRSLRPWWTWEPALTHREPEALDRAREELSGDIRRETAIQYLFERQWRRLRSTCADHGVRLIGDIPIFVAHDSADVWSRQDIYLLDPDGIPTVVAGVPPDYFSPTGQRWGNPLYRWTVHAEGDFSWWRSRLGRVFDLFDLVRIDHFRGFSAYWEIPADEPTAVRGRWVQAPGQALFDRVRFDHPDLPVIAEDLGVITPDVETLRDRYGFPGMQVIQFGFTFQSSHHPDHIRPDVVAYTGTHDNDTLLGWLSDPENGEDRAAVMDYLGVGDLSDANWRLIEVLHRSTARLAVVPLQDVLGLGSEARMNTPATTHGNWRWRMRREEMSHEHISRMRRSTEASGRT